MINDFEVMQALLGEAVGTFDLGGSFAFISSDSRRCENGCLFVSLAASEELSVRHAADAVARGATGVVSEHKLSLNGTPCVQVKNAERAHYRLGAAWRQKFRIPIVAVAGNVGKTTTKEMLAHLLREAGLRVLKTDASQNGFQGIPATLIKLRPEHDVAVIEVGIDEPDTMITHAAAVRPSVVLIPSLGVEHLSKLKNAEVAAREEFELALWAKASGAPIVLNGDNEFCRRLSVELLHDGFILHSLGGTDTAQCVGTVVGQTLAVADRTTNSTLKVACTVVGEHNASNLLGAVAAALRLGVSPPLLSDAAAFVPVDSGRSEVKIGPKGATYLCDYYNASPDSMAAAFATLKQLAADRSGGRIWCCLGDMLDLGENEERFHRDLARLLPESAGILTVGIRMQMLQNELGAVYPYVKRFHFQTCEEMASILHDLLDPKDVVLIKGSRGMTMEKVWYALERLQ